MSEIQDKHAEANRIVRRHMYASLAIGAVPLVGVDMVALTILQLKMLRDLANFYNVDFSNQLGQCSIAALVGGGGEYLPVTLAKFIPIAGWLATLGCVALYSGASTYAIGKVFIQHFASGGTFLTFDPKKVKDYYEKEFTQGRVEVQKSYAGVKP